MKKIILIALGVSVFAVSCKKGDDVRPDNNITVSSMLTSKAWKIIGGSSTLESPGGTETTDSYSLWPSCMKDDLCTFGTDHTIMIDEGTVKCHSANSQQRITGTWTLSNNDTKLIFTDPFGSSKTCNILTLNSSTLEISEVYSTDTTTRTSITKYTH